MKSGADIHARTFRKDAPINLAGRVYDVKKVLDVIQILLEKGADPNSETWFKSTPLHTVAAMGHTEAVDLLLRYGSKIEWKSGRGETPLHYACWYRGGIKMVKKLESVRANFSAVSIYGETMLHVAARGYDKNVNDVMSYLLNEKHFNIDVRTYKNSTPLHLAAESKHFKNVVYLVENNADVNAKTYKNTTALHFAAVYNRFKNVVYLVENNADVNAKRAGGMTPLDYAKLNPRNYGQDK